MPNCDIRISLVTMRTQHHDLPLTKLNNSIYKFEYAIVFTIHHQIALFNLYLRKSAVIIIGSFCRSASPVDSLRLPLLYVLISL